MHRDAPACGSTGPVAGSVGISARVAGIASNRDEQAALYDPLVDVETQDASRNPSFRRQRLNDQSIEPEVIGPAIRPRIEEPDDAARLVIQSRDVCALPRVASDARERQIRFIGCASMLSADDVIDLVAGIRIGFVQQAILTTMRRPAGNQGAEPIIDVIRQAGDSVVLEPWP